MLLNGQLNPVFLIQHIIGAMPSTFGLNQYLKPYLTDNNDSGCRIIVVARERFDMRILAVDDDMIMLEILSGVIDVAGYQHLTLASSGKDALRYIANSTVPYDCLLLDIQMPEMDGIQLCEKIRAIEGYDETPIIMVTAMSDKTYVEAAFIAGATDYVTKPFDVLELGARIKMAERLIDSRAELKVKTTQATRIQNELNSKYRSVHTSSIGARSIQGLIEFERFEQKLTMFSKKELISSSVYAVKLASANVIFSQLLASEQKLLIQEITLAITESLPAEGSFVAYRGNGVFVCVSKRSSRSSEKAIEFNLSYLIDNMEASEFGARQGNIRLSVGKSVPRIMSSPQPITMIAEAIEGAEKSYRRAVA